MKRKRILVFAAMVGLLFPTTVNAGPPIPNQVSIPGGVDASVLMTPTNGPVVATGTLTDAGGRPVAGTVAVVAWPSEAANRKLSVGSAVFTPTVGWASAGPDGAFDVRIDANLFPAEYVNPDGRVNLEAIGWTAKAQGRWSFSSRIDSQAAEASASVGPEAPAAIAIKASDALVTSSDAGAGPSPQFVNCWWVLQSTYDAWVIVGHSWPYGSDKGWMKSTTSHSETVGVATSVSGTYGSWSANGTSSTTSGVTFTWAESISYRDFRDQHHYGVYRYKCDGYYQNSWMAKELYPTGGYTTAYASNPGFTYSCVQVSAGEWVRNGSSGHHLVLSGGVKISGLLGIDLSLDTNWTTAHELHYRLVASGKVCGDNDYPAYASRVRTTR